MGNYYALEGSTPKFDSFGCVVNNSGDTGEVLFLHGGTYEKADAPMTEDSRQTSKVISGAIDETFRMAKRQHNPSLCIANLEEGNGMRSVIELM